MLYCFAGAPPPASAPAGACTGLESIAQLYRNEARHAWIGLESVHCRYHLPPVHSPLSPKGELVLLTSDRGQLDIAVNLIANLAAVGVQLRGAIIRIGVEKLGEEDVD